MYKIQYYDTDCECWVDDEEIEPIANKWDAEDDLKAAKRRYAYFIKMRVVKE